MSDVRQIALVISDIDGTLITSNHEVTQATKRSAQALFENGIRLALASSRPPRAIAPIAGALGLDAPYAAFNGGMIVASDGSLIAGSTLEAPVTLAVKKIASGLGLDVWLYDAHDWWASERTPFVEREEHTAGFAAQFAGYNERLASPLNKLTVVGRPDRVEVAEAKVLKELVSQVSASRSKPRFLDITAHGWHKGAVVSRFAGVFGCREEEVAVIGDGPNDVEMFARAGVSIAMGQAVEYVRSHARFLTSSNDEEGWARGIERFVLGRAAS
jgi:Cof subfamily protein (haloacid dehalogenase superfamily)